MSVYGVERAGTQSSGLEIRTGLTRRGFVGRAVVLGAGTIGGGLSLVAGMQPAGAQDGTTEAAAFPGREAFADLDTKQLVKAIRTVSFGDANVDAMVEALARSGIAVYSSVDDVQPIAPVDGEPSPVRLLRTQARNLALQVSARGGQLGADLDGLVPTGDGKAVPSIVLAAYATAGTTPGAELARALVGSPDPDRAATTLYPMVVQLLVGSDVVRDARAGIGTNGGAGQRRLLPSALAYRAPENWLCDLIDPIVQQSVEEILTILQDVPAPGGGTVFDPDKLDERASKALVDDIAGAVGILVLAGHLLSIVKGWSVRVVPDPTEVYFGVGDLGSGGLIETWVDVGGVSTWSDGIKECATKVGLPLPTLSASGAPLDWEVTEKPIPLVEFQPLPGSLNEKGRAVFNYRTNTESPEAAEGEERRGKMTVRATIHRTDLEALYQDLSLFFYRKLVRIPSYEMTGLEDEAESLWPQFQALQKETGQATVTVIYHEGKKKKAKTKKSTPKIDRKLVGQWEVVDIGNLISALLGRDDALPMDYLGQQGSLTYNFDKDGNLGVAADDFATGCGSVIEGIEVHATMFVEGLGGGTWASDGTTLSLDLSDASGLEVIWSTLAGGQEVYRGGHDDAERFLPHGAVGYQIDGAALLLYPHADLPAIVLERIG